MTKVGTEQNQVALAFGEVGEEATSVSAANPLPVTLAAGEAEASGLATEAKQDDGNASLAAIETAVEAAVPAGTNLIGKVGIDQTTPGTTNAVVANGGVASGAADAGNPVKVAGVYLAAVPTLDSGDRGDIQLDVNGAVRSRLVTAAGGASDNFSNGLGFVTAGFDQSTVCLLAEAGFVFNATGWDRERKPSGVARLLSAAASTNATVVKAGAGDLHKITGYAAAAVFLKIYNKATEPTVGTDTPVLTFRLAATANFAFDLDAHYFSAGISFALTTAAADADTGAVAAGDVLCMNITYA